MDLELANKSALVTGGSRGIGRSIAELLCAEGCRVAINGRTHSDLMTATTNLTDSVAIVGDVTKTAGAKKIVADAIEALGGIDILICNVGSGRSVPPGEETYNEWQRIFDVNLWSATNMVEAARPALASSKGSVVCISSICGLEVVPGAPITYSSAKAALHAYVRGIAHPLGEQGVRINAVAPGNILFEGSVWTDKLSKDGDAVKKMLDREVALTRLGTPQEVAKLVAFLASPSSGFTTGKIWALDGGQVRS